MLATSPSSQGGPTYKPAPKELIGTRDYYIWRDANAPPEIRGDNYYLNYGLRKFDDFQALREGASPELQAFIDRASVELQRSLERALQLNPAIELRRSDLLGAAFDTHSDAYARAGFRNLSLADQFRVGRTVGVGDFFGAGVRSGFREAWQVYTAPAP